MPAPDGRFDAAARDAALKALLATGLFDNVTIDRAGERLVVHLTEAPVLDRVAFEGNKKIKDKDLDGRRGIQAARHAAARHGAGRCRPHHGSLPACRARRCRRGAADHRPRQRPGRPRLCGDGRAARRRCGRSTSSAITVFGKRQLAAVIKTSATNMLSFLTGGDDYDPDRIAADREQLRLYYRSKGYADASVTSAKAEYDPAIHGFTLTFSIDEGPLYHFGDINVVCNVPGLDSEKLRRLLVARPGAVFDGNALDKTSEVLAIELAKLGFPFAQATPRTTRDAAAQRIDVAFTIDQGAAHLCRAHRNPRQHPHPRLCDPARIRYRRRRCLQQDPDRSRRTAAEEPELFQDRQDFDGSPARRRTASCSMSRWPNNRPAISTSPAVTRRPTACSPRSSLATAISSAPATR